MTEAQTLGASRVEASPIEGRGGSSPRPGWVNHHRVRRYAPPVAAIAVYAVLAAVAFWPVPPFSESSMSSCACSDPAQETWFLAYTAFAVRHGTNPFFTTLLNHPAGVNLLSNTAMPLLGLIGAPITWLAGPVATFNALMRLGFLLSATSMMLVVHRLARWWPAAFLAGLLYGFAPYMIGQGFGHLFLVFVPLPPLILLCFYELLTRPAARPWLRGGLLGLLCAVQFLISIEVLVTTGICAGIVGLVALVRRPRAGWGRFAGAGRGLAAATGVFAVLAAYPIWFFLEGPQHISGPPHAVANLAPIKADLLSFVVPTLNERIGPSHLLAVGTAFAAGDRPENGVYLGIPLLVLLVYLLVRYRRDERVVLGALLAAAGAVLSLGTPLLVDGHSTHVPLPFWFLLHVPLLKGSTAIRFGLFEQLGAALVLGVGLARLREPPAPARRPWRRDAAVLAVAVAALVPLLPRWPYPSQHTGLPTYVSTAAVDEIPQGSTVLTYPWDVDPVNEPMLWQAVSQMRFAIFGGQLTRPGRDGLATSGDGRFDPPVVQQLFAAGLYGDAPKVGAPLPPFDRATIDGIVEFCRRNGVRAVIVEPQGTNAAEVVRDLAAALGPPEAKGGVDVWPDVPARLASGAPASP